MKLTYAHNDIRTYHALKVRVLNVGIVTRKVTTRMNAGYDLDMNALTSAKIGIKRLVLTDKEEEVDNPEVDGKRISATGP